MNIHKKIAEIRQYLIVAFILLSAIVCPFAYGQNADIQASFLIPPERSGFFKIDITFRSYVPPPREIIFIYIPGGEQQQDASAINAISQFIENLNPNDTFRIIYPKTSENILNENIFRNKAGQQIISTRWLFPSPIRRQDVTMEAIQKKLELLNNSTPLSIPQKIIGMIESALIQIRDSSKPVTGIVIVISPPKNGYMPAESKIKLLEGLPNFNTSLDLDNLAESISLKKIPRLNFILFEDCPEIEKSFRQLAFETNGFFIKSKNYSEEMLKRASARFHYDFFRTINISSPADDAGYVHNDMWNFEGKPEVLSVVGRCCKASGLKIAVRDSFGQVIADALVSGDSAQDPDIPMQWARIRASDIERRALAYGGTSLDYSELAYLKREWNILSDIYDPVSDAPISTNISAGADEESAKKSKRNDDTEKKEIPPHSVLEEIIPADSAYALFSSVPVAFKFLDSIDKILRDLDPGVASSVGILSIEENVKKQLCLDYNRGYYILYYGVVGEVAVATDDLSIPSNPQVTGFFALKHPLLFRMRTAEYRSRMRSRYPDLKVAKLKQGRHNITFISSSSGNISSYIAYVKIKKREIAIVSNSLASIRKTLDTVDGKSPAIIDDELFPNFRRNVPYQNGNKNGHSAYIGISKAFTEKIKSKRYARMYSLKQKCRDSLNMLDNSAELFRREYPDLRIESAEMLAKMNFVNADIVNNEFAFDERAECFRSKIFGVNGNMAFIDDIEDSVLINSADVPADIITIGNYLKPVALGIELNRQKADFNLISHQTSKGSLHKLADRILIKNPSESVAPLLKWDGHLLSMRTDVFAPKSGISLSASKEQIIIKTILTTLRSKLKTEIQWKSSKDVLSWVGNEIIVGFKDARTGMENFLHNSQGFIIIEIRDNELAREFLVAFSETHGNRNNNPPKSETEKGLLSSLSFAGIADKWMVLSNDRDVFNYVTRKLTTPDTKLTKTEMPLNARLVLGNNDALKTFLSKFLAGNGDIFAKTFSKCEKDVSSEKFPPLYKRHIYPDAGSKRILLDINAGIAGDWLRSSGTLYLDIPRRKKSKRTLEEMQSLYASNRFKLSQPSKLASALAQIGDEMAAEFLETQSTKLGWSEGRRLLTRYSKGNDLTKIYALKLLRELDSKRATKEIARIRKNSPPKNPQVLKEMNRTLLRLREKSTILEIYNSIIMHNVKTYELEVVEKQRIPEMATALVSYILDVENNEDGDREIRQWLAAESAGSKTNLGLCISALSAIGKPAMLSIIDAVTQADERQKEMLTIATLSMSDLGKDDLITLKENVKEDKATEFIDRLIAEFE